MTMSGQKTFKSSQLSKDVMTWLRKCPRLEMIAFQTTRDPSKWATQLGATSRYDPILSDKDDRPENIVLEMADVCQKDGWIVRFWNRDIEDTFDVSPKELTCDVLDLTCSPNCLFLCLH